LPLPFPGSASALGGGLAPAVETGTSTDAEDLDEASIPRSLACAAAALDEELPGAGAVAGVGGAGRVGAGAG
jgi:hypothetical protein